ncbi:unnamed protein product [Notodromas monacha]|uniref:Succinate dehydrogenase [ubiquinone] cytochrome b small subunit n=1 Tax=Notodromas monacha TaxID=399045 RepID=A0A7R9BHZ9_9CRUS|nr:unnamed protein product [Notodromas monacha]CAG0915574.1 unnamed protein product [Notodromas monacha]
MMLPMIRSASVLYRSTSTKLNPIAIAALNRTRSEPVDRSASQLVPVRTASSAVAVNRGKHWAFERVITLGLVGLIPASFVVYHPSMDYILAMGLCLHSHWGLHGVCADYIRPKLFGAALAKLAEVIVYILSFLAFGSVMYFNYTDVGLIPAFRMLWKL